MKENKQGNGGDIGIHVTRSFPRIVVFMLSFSKNRYGLGECVYQISVLYSFSFGQDVGDKHTHSHLVRHAHEQI